MTIYSTYHSVFGPSVWYVLYCLMHNYKCFIKLILLQLMQYIWYSYGILTDICLTRFKIQYRISTRL